MKPYYEQDGIAIINGDCREVLPTLEPVAAVVTDPPYGLRFMGKRWDYDVPGVDVWEACLRVLKPGGYLLAFAGTRTQHRMAVNIEDAGFEIRDMIAWVYGSGFPKSHDVSKAIDKAAGAERQQIRVRPGVQTAHHSNAGNHRPWMDNPDHTLAGPEPATDDARRWDGFGTALKPALEPITMARKPLEGTIAQNVLAHGTGALDIDGCRVGTERMKVTVSDGSFQSPNRSMSGHNTGRRPAGTITGRWPANLIHDSSPEVLALFPETGPSKQAQIAKPLQRQDNRILGKGLGSIGPDNTYNDSGSAARFFYSPKASGTDRGNKDLPALPLFGVESEEIRNEHPTVKPVDLMIYLCRLVTPPGGIVLDPFMGSGTTLLAAKRLGRKAIGIEIEERYCEIAAERLSQGRLF